MVTVTYRNESGVMRRLAVPDIEGIDPGVVLSGVVRTALADSGPIAAVRLIAALEDTEDEQAASYSKPAAAAADRANAPKRD